MPATSLFVRFDAYAYYKRLDLFFLSPALHFGELNHQLEIHLCKIVKCRAGFRKSLVTFCTILLSNKYLDASKCQAILKDDDDDDVSPGFFLLSPLFLFSETSPRFHLPDSTLIKTRETMSGSGDMCVVKCKTDWTRLQRKKRKKIKKTHTLVLEVFNDRPTEP